MTTSLIISMHSDLPLFTFLEVVIVCFLNWTQSKITWEEPQWHYASMGHVCGGVLWACLWGRYSMGISVGCVIWSCLWGRCPVGMSVGENLWVCHLGMSVGGCPESMYYIEPLSSGNPLKCSSLTDLFNCNLNILCSRKLKLNGPLMPNQYTLSHTGWDIWPFFTIKNS